MCLMIQYHIFTCFICILSLNGGYALRCPVVDILNRNYPDLLNNFTTCFFCHNEKEMNVHLWSCPSIHSLLQPIFTKHHDILRTLIVSNSDFLPTLYEDSIIRCSLFTWSTHNNSLITDFLSLHYLLMNFVPEDLVYLFTAAKISKAN